MSLVSRKLSIIILIMFFVSLSVYASGQNENEESAVEAGDKSSEENVRPYSLAVVVPGVAAGSPLYEQLVEGAEKAVNEYPGASMKVVELGYNQAEWTEKMTNIVASGAYDAVITSNPSMPYVCLDIAEQFPEQKFIFVDGYISGNQQMASFLYNQVEQSYMLGHLAGLITTGQMPGSNPDLKIGLIVAQEYPALNKMIVPGFMKGAESVNKGIKLDYRVVGNWYDAAKAGELAKSMIDAGVDVIGVVAGGAAQGVFEVCRERGKYVMYWDDNSYSKAPGVIAGCGALHQSQLVYEVVSDAVNGIVDYGTGTVLSARDGYIEFVSSDQNYIDLIPEDIREEQQRVVDSIISGKLVLEAPEL